MAAIKRIAINKRTLIKKSIYLVGVFSLTTIALLIANLIDGDLFMGWGFGLLAVPVFPFFQAFLALPTTLFGEMKGKRAGWIAWLLTTSVLIVGGVVLIFSRWQPIAQHLDNMMFYIVWFVVPQAATYHLSPDRPLYRPLVAAGLGLGATLLWFIVAILTGSTPD